MTPPESPDVHELARIAAVHEQRISDHDKVLVDIRSHLGDIVKQFDKFRTTVLIVSVTMLAGSPTGHDVLTKLVG